MTTRFENLLVTLTTAMCIALTSTCALAGTTGAISGTVVDAQTGTPIAGARVTAVSPSQSAAAVTDSGGHYAFVSLAPDEYTLQAVQNGYEPVSLSGVAVFADATQVLPITLHRTLKTIANVTSRSASSWCAPERRPTSIPSMPNNRRASTYWAAGET